MIVYNIEDFVIKQMFLPYKTLLISEDNLPSGSFEKAKEYAKREKACISELRKNPERIIDILKNNKEAYRCVFTRLANMDFKFYKWLKHSLINDIEAITLAFRIELRGANNG